MLDEWIRHKNTQRSNMVTLYENAQTLQSWWLKGAFRWLYPAHWEAGFILIRRLQCLLTTLSCTHPVILQACGQCSIGILCLCLCVCVYVCAWKAGNYQCLCFLKVAGCLRWHGGQGTAIDHSLPHGPMAPLCSSVTVLYLSHTWRHTQKHKYAYMLQHLPSNQSLSVFKSSPCSVLSLYLI